MLHELARPFQTARGVCVLHAAKTGLRADSEAQVGGGGAAVV